MLTACAVFVTVVLLYKGIAHLVYQYKSIENLVEGKPLCFVENGTFNLKNFKKEELSQDEFFAELRLHGVSNLGQLELAILEISGDVSVFYYPDEQVRYGLPILPDSLKKPLKAIPKSAHYACVFCGDVHFLEPRPQFSCPHCGKALWVVASNKLRVG